LAGVSWGTLGSGNGQFHLPFHAVVNTATNRAYVSDYWNDRVQVFDLSGGVDVTPPTVASFTVGTNTSAVVNFNLTFSESVTGVTTDDFTVNLVGGATGTVGAPTGS